MGGEELFPESAVTPLVEWAIAPGWKMVGCLVALLSQRRRWMVPTSAYANFCQIFSKMGFDDNSQDEGKCESPRIHRFRWWAWVDLNHQPRPYQCSGPRSRAWNTGSLMSTGAYFNSADDLASVPSDWIARKKNTIRRCHGRIRDHSMADPSPAGSERALLNISRDISLREPFVKVRELRIQLTLRPWPIADPRR